MMSAGRGMYLNSDHRKRGCVNLVLTGPGFEGINNSSKLADVMCEWTLMKCNLGKVA